MVPTGPITITNNLPADGCADGEIMSWDDGSSAWICSTGGSGGGTVQTDSTLSGDGSAGSPLSIAQNSATNGQVLTWNGSAWSPAASTGESLPDIISAPATFGLTEEQSIATNGAFDWEHFTIGSDTYLAVANFRNGSTYNLNSKIYKWNGSSFAEVQSIATCLLYTSDAADE